MPTVLSHGAYRFYFYSHEPNEPAHVHIDREKLSAKFWINPVSLARNFGYSAHELKRIEQIIIEHQFDFLEKWNGHFGISG